MSDNLIVEEAWVVYCIETQEFLCGTPTNRRFGEFREARIFRKRSAASNSKAMLPTAKKPVVLPITVSVDRKNMFKTVLAGGE
jgi:hypothetical protein